MPRPPWVVLIAVGGLLVGGLLVGGLLPAPSLAPLPCPRAFRQGGRTWCEFRGSVLGAGRCRRQESRAILRAAGRGELTRVVRELGHHPVLHNRQWDLEAAALPRVLRRPPHLGWTEVRPGTEVFVFDGFMAPAEVARATERAAASEAPRERDAWGDYDAGTYTAQLTGCLFQRIESVVALGGDREWQRRSAATLGVPAESFWSTVYVSRFTSGGFLTDHFDEDPCVTDAGGAGALGDMLRNGTLRPRADCATRRTGTLLVYLTTEGIDHVGGFTEFPKLGIRIRPRRGRGLFFYPTFADGSTNPATVHSSTQVTNGTKLSLQQWMSETRDWG